MMDSAALVDDNLLAVLNAISRASMRRALKDYLMEKAVTHELQVLSAVQPDTLLERHQQVIDAAKPFIENPTSAKLQAKLVQLGHIKLARRVEKVARARHQAAHPDLTLANEVAEALLEPPGSSDGNADHSDVEPASKVQTEMKLEERKPHFSNQWKKPYHADESAALLCDHVPSFGDGAVHRDVLSKPIVGPHEQSPAPMNKHIPANTTDRQSGISGDLGSHGPTSSDLARKPIAQNVGSNPAAQVEPNPAVKLCLDGTVRHDVLSKSVAVVRVKPPAPRNEHTPAYAIDGHSGAFGDSGSFVPTSSDPVRKPIAHDFGSNPEVHSDSSFAVQSDAVPGMQEPSTSKVGLQVRRLQHLEIANSEKSQRNHDSDYAQVRAMAPTTTGAATQCDDGVDACKTRTGSLASEVGRLEQVLARLQDDDACDDQEIARLVQDISSLQPEAARRRERRTRK